MQTNNCQICCENKIEDDFLKLVCEHSFCRECLRKNLEEKINNGSSDLRCPDISCGKAFNSYQLKEVLSQEFINRYDNLLRLALRGDPAEDTITLNPNTQERTISYPPKSMKQRDEDFENYIIGLGWKRCPGCDCVIEKIDKGGCNYIKCESMKCAKKITFCYICGEKINNLNEHYKDKNYANCVKKKLETKHYNNLTLKGEKGDELVNKKINEKIPNSNKYECLNCNLI